MLLSDLYSAGEGVAAMLKATVAMTLLTVFVAPGALAEGEASEANTIVEAGTAQGTEVGSAWALRQSYGVSLMRLSQAGQGFGARLSLVPAAGPAGRWEASADAVFRVANDSPWYLKGLGGVAVASPIGLWPPRLRAGVEVGLTAMRGGIGLEAGVSVIDSFAPVKPLEGQASARPRRPKHPMAHPGVALSPLQQARRKG